ncbi:hypothetical protein WN51_10478 [Melipona quadrifasciata]|uniref:Uncharacterized protein n=1 Tax=Melipona quadrifasciata TaxID=166423 RepID=A0A0N0BI24_9HYME|nr:hypothetical protein WN51_10478 [Melipona quadrifasciata]
MKENMKDLRIWQMMKQFIVKIRNRNRKVRAGSKCRNRRSVCVASNHGKKEKLSIREDREAFADAWSKVGWEKVGPRRSGSEVERHKCNLFSPVFKWEPIPIRGRNILAIHVARLINSLRRLALEVDNCELLLPMVPSQECRGINYHWHCGINSFADQQRHVLRDLNDFCKIYDGVYVYLVIQCALSNLITLSVISSNLKHQGECFCKLQTEAKGLALFFRLLILEQEKALGVKAIKVVELQRQRSVYLET